VESTGHKKIWALSALIAGTVGVAMVAWTTPASLQAAAQGTARSIGLASGVHPAYTSGRVVETTPGQWDLQVGISWTCAMDHNGVEQAAGLIRLWSPTQPDLRIDLPCTLNARVQPGQSVSQYVSIHWDERSPVHEWLRHGTPDEVRSDFVVEWAVGATPVDTDLASVGANASRQRSSSGLQTGHVSLAPR